MTRLSLFLILALLFTILSLALAHDEAIRGGSISLPDLFNFEAFKRHYGKQYGSLVEEMARQRIFVGRAFRAVASLVAYKLFRTSHFLSVNPTSDETPEERAARRLEVAAMRSSKEQLKMAAYDDLTKGGFNATGGPKVSLEELRPELADLKRLREEPAFAPLVEELDKVSSQERRKRQVDPSSGRRAQLGWSDLVEPAEWAEPPEVRAKMRARVPGNNPRYEPVEAPSSAPNGPPAATGQQQPNFLRMLAGGADFLRQVVETTVNSATSADNSKRDQQSEDPKSKVHVDLRQTRCLLQPRSQGHCGACYAFATIALYEYLYCRSTGHLVAFSEQYMIDCGPRLATHASGARLQGCRSGHIPLAVDFVERHGLELRHHYPYRQHDHDSCPYEPGTPTPSMGYLRTRHPHWAELELGEWAEYLKSERRPVVVGLKLTPDFHDYGGGVDAGSGCGAEGGHALLLIGHGREDGEEYWLLRNSHSVSWGELGYYKFAKRALPACLVNERGIVSLSDFDGLSHLEKTATKTPNAAIQQHYRRHLEEETSKQEKDNAL